jgi:hypothetical protein
VLEHSTRIARALAGRLWNSDLGMASWPILTSLCPRSSARLRYRLRGTGPLLVLVPGGDAAASDALAAHLADTHPVLTYDRRDLSGSVLDDPSEPPTVTTHTEDLHHPAGRADHRSRVRRRTACPTWSSSSPMTRLPSPDTGWTWRR